MVPYKTSIICILQILGEEKTKETSTTNTETKEASGSLTKETEQENKTKSHGASHVQTGV